MSWCLFSFSWRPQPGDALRFHENPGDCLLQRVPTAKDSSACSSAGARCRCSAHKSPCACTNAFEPDITSATRSEAAEHSSVYNTHLTPAKARITVRGRTHKRCCINTLHEPLASTLAMTLSAPPDAPCLSGNYRLESICTRRQKELSD